MSKAVWSFSSLQRSSADEFNSCELFTLYFWLEILFSQVPAVLFFFQCKVLTLCSNSFRNNFFAFVSVRIWLVSSSLSRAIPPSTRLSVRHTSPRLQLLLFQAPSFSPGQHGQHQTLLFYWPCVEAAFIVLASEWGNTVTYLWRMVFASSVLMFNPRSASDCLISAKFISPVGGNSH